MRKIVFAATSILLVLGLGLQLSADPLSDALAGKFKGKTVRVSGPFTDNDAVKFNASMADFVKKTGIKIEYEGSKEFESSIRVRIEGGNPPDIADFPQPGLLASFASKGYVVDVSKFLDMNKLKANYNQSWLDMATVQGKDGKIVAGVWQRVNGKSLVWYNKKAFDKAGYKIPTTWAELIKLSDQIKSDGDSPWAIGIESGAATGWVATDWIEDILLRTASLEDYDNWVAGKLKFDSPQLRKAIQTMSDIWFKDGYVNGGKKSIVTTSFGDASKALFTNPPGAWLHRQGNFITSFFPNNLVAGVDYDFFYFPGIDAKYGKPVLVAGDIMAMFNDKPEVRAVMQYFTTGASVEGWVKAGGAISPHKDSNLSWYSNYVDRKVAEIILNATSLRFDASDLMPGAVGAGSFWKQMTSYVNGDVSLVQAARAIDASWPK